MSRKTKKILKICLIAALAIVAVCTSYFFSCGCGTAAGYVISQAGGQIKILNESVLIEDVIKDEKNPEETRRKLTLVQEARKYATDNLGFEPDSPIYPYIKKIPVINWLGKFGGSYAAYYDTNGEVIAWNVTAAKKDSLTPLTWWFPIFGDVPYLSYFKRQDAEALEKKLLKAGYDVELAGVEAYSTVGWLRDPIFSPMLDSTDYYLISVMYHEMTHEEVYSPRDANFNETVASFLGEEAAAVFFAARGDKNIRPEFSEIADDEALFNQLISKLAADLTMLYRWQKKRLNGDDEILFLREVFFNDFRDKVKKRQDSGAFHHPENYDFVQLWDINNATVLSHIRYRGNIGAVRELYELSDQSFPLTLRRLKECAKAKNPFDALFLMARENKNQRQK